ncbi:RNA-binding S4 domain-containing protein [Sphingorhabdus arenilitoris]|uniref:RNA-binding S4 domain-containing protein n=1 Tax=Sphingorhabdus arenilitoris TaxID=1490041 RepID=A0ABV8RGL9_9SPHN
MSGAGLRIDKLLWYLRFSKSRTLAQHWVEQGHIRVNGNRITRPSFAIHLGDVITLPRGEGILVIRMEILPHRRGPAEEAKSHYLCL